MDDASTALVAGLATGALALVARRAPIVGWFTLVPLGLALATCGAWAALAGAVAGAILHGAVTLTQPPPLRPLGFLFGGVGWGTAAGIAGAVLHVVPLGDGAPRGAALAAALLLVAVAAGAPMRRAGAPRWIHAPLACTQEPWPVVLRAGWFLGDAAVTALLSLSASSVVLLVPGPAASPRVAAALGCLVLAVLVLAARSIARSRRAIATSPRVRVAAVVADGPPPLDAAPDGLWPLKATAYRDVEATVRRYAPHVARAADEGAELVVLPEVAVHAGGDDATRFLDAAEAWARAHGVTVVAPRFDPAIPVNTLTIVEPSGRRTDHDKQHPAPGLEPPRRRLEAPGPVDLERGWPISTVICVDLDHADLVAPVRAAGGLLVVPSNDWPGSRFDELHDRTAAWAAVLTCVTVVRATGHGVSSARDGSGRILARASSRDGAVVLVVDVPLARAR